MPLLPRLRLEGGEVGLSYFSILDISLALLLHFAGGIPASQEQCLIRFESVSPSTVLGTEQVFRKYLLNWIADGGKWHYPSHFAVEETEEGKAKTCWTGGRHDRDYLKEELGWGWHQRARWWAPHSADLDRFPRWFQSTVKFQRSAKSVAHRHNFFSKYFWFATNDFWWLSQSSDGLFLLVQFILSVKVFIHFQVK